MAMLSSTIARTLVCCGLLAIACDKASNIPTLGSPRGEPRGPVFSTDPTAPAGPTNACGQPPLEGCIAQTLQSEVLPLDLYILFDQSESMCTCLGQSTGRGCPDPSCAQTRLDAVRQAMGEFLAAKESRGIGVGLGIFGDDPLGFADCNSASYSSSTVAIAPLPGNERAVTSAMQTLVPTGETPTGPALRGACTFAQTWKSSHPERNVALLLLTDGKPEAPLSCLLSGGACCPSIEEATAAAQACLEGAPGIKTYVLGVGPLLDNLNDIALAGGTGAAYLVESNDVAKNVLEALQRIRSDAIPCQLGLPAAPAGSELSLDEVNLTYTAADCDTTLIEAVPSAAQCGRADGWYYDNPTRPSVVNLCPASCDRVSGDGRLDYSIGCTTQVRLQ
jgi:hypothetical protein